MEVMKEIVEGEDIKMDKHMSLAQYFCSNLKCKYISLHEMKFEKIYGKYFKMWNIKISIFVFYFLFNSRGCFLNGTLTSASALSFTH